MMKLRTVCQAVREVRERDPDTALTETFLRYLIQRRIVSTVSCGCRECIDIDTMENELSILFGSNGEGCPKLRTIRNAAKEIRMNDSCSPMTEYRIRMLIKIGRLQSVAVGTRQIIAMEAFEDSSIFGKTYLEAKPARSSYARSVSFSDQFDKVLSETTQRYICQRKRA